MYDVDRNLLKKLESSENRFKDVRKIAETAKRIAKHYDGQLFHSEAISCVVTQSCPKYDYKRCDDKLDSLIKDMFCEVENVEIRNAVYDSLMLSRKKHYLIYIYNNIEDASQQARVRVLTNMLWYEASD